MTRRSLCGQIGYRHSPFDRRALGLFGGGFPARQFQHFRGARPRYEADPRVVGKHNVAWGHPNTGDDDLAVNLNGFDTPFAGDRRYLASPNGITDAARMSHIANRTENYRAEF